MLDAPCSQAAFGELVGMSQQAVSDLVARKVLVVGATARSWLLAYCEHLRTIAAGRDPDGSLVLQRARLAQEQADSYALKNAIARREYAPVSMLADVLAAASAAMVDRFDALPSELRKVCPDLPQDARDAIGRAIANARNECIRNTEAAALQRAEGALEALTADDDDRTTAALVDGRALPEVTA